MFFFFNIYFDRKKVKIEFEDKSSVDTDIDTDDSCVINKELYIDWYLRGQVELLSVLSDDLTDMIENQDDLTDTVDN